MKTQRVRQSSRVYFSWMSSHSMSTTPRMAPNAVPMILLSPDLKLLLGCGDMVWHLCET
jgi:hypothetical protein